MNKKEYNAKQKEIFESHPDRLLVIKTPHKYKTSKAYINALVKEAKKKGYTILPSDNKVKRLRGLIIYKEIDGIEIAYNPSWSHETISSEQFVYFPKNK